MSWQAGRQASACAARHGPRKGSGVTWSSARRDGFGGGRAARRGEDELPRRLVRKINAFIAENAIEHMRAPLYRVAGFDTPFPYTLEHDYMPTTDRIMHFIRKSAAY